VGAKGEYPSCGLSPGHTAPTPRGLARRARALRVARAPAGALPARRQDQDEQLSPESPASPEVPCKVPAHEGGLSSSLGDRFPKQIDDTKPPGWSSCED